ncbi:MAG: hypothetical protein QW156_04700 [Candidatus Aenigmatarchaeota archaeon]
MNNLTEDIKILTELFINYKKNKKCNDEWEYIFEVIKKGLARNFIKILNDKKKGNIYLKALRKNPKYKNKTKKEIIIELQNILKKKGN